MGGTGYAGAFVSISLDEPAGGLQVEVSGLRARCCLEWVPSNELHLTVGYLGWLATEDAATLADSLLLLAQFSPRTVQLTGEAAVVGSGGKFHLIAGLVPSVALSSLGRELAEKCVQIGLREPVSRAPHVTLARLSDSVASVSVVPTSMRASSPVLVAPSICYVSIPTAERMA